MFCGCADREHELQLRNRKPAKLQLKLKNAASHTMSNGETPVDSDHLSEASPMRERGPTNESEISREDEDESTSQSQQPPPAAAEAQRQPPLKELSEEVASPLPADKLDAEESNESNHGDHAKTGAAAATLIAANAKLREQIASFQSALDDLQEDDVEDEKERDDGVNGRPRGKNGKRAAALAAAPPPTASAKLLAQKRKQVEGSAKKAKTYARQNKELRARLARILDDGAAETMDTLLAGQRAAISRLQASNREAQRAERKRGKRMEEETTASPKSLAVKVATLQDQIAMERKRLHKVRERTALAQAEASRQEEHAFKLRERNRILQSRVNEADNSSSSSSSSNGYDGDGTTFATQQKVPPPTTATTSSSTGTAGTTAAAAAAAAATGSSRRTADAVKAAKADLASMSKTHAREQAGLAKQVRKEQADVKDGYATVELLDADLREADRKLRLQGIEVNKAKRELQDLVKPPPTRNSSSNSSSSSSRGGRGTARKGRARVADELAEAEAKLRGGRTRGQERGRDGGGGGSDGNGGNGGRSTTDGRRPSIKGVSAARRRGREKERKDAALLDGNEEEEEEEVVVVEEEEEQEQEIRPEKDVDGDGEEGAYNKGEDTTTARPAASSSKKPRRPLRKDRPQSSRPRRVSMTKRSGDDTIDEGVGQQQQQQQQLRDLEDEALDLVLRDADRRSEALGKVHTIDDLGVMSSRRSPVGDEEEGGGEDGDEVRVDHAGLGEALEEVKEEEEREQEQELVEEVAEEEAVREAEDTCIDEGEHDSTTGGVDATPLSDDDGEPQQELQHASLESDDSERWVSDYARSAVSGVLRRAMDGVSETGDVDDGDEGRGDEPPSAEDKLSAEFRDLPPAAGVALGGDEEGEDH